MNKKLIKKTNYKTFEPEYEKELGLFCPCCDFGGIDGMLLISCASSTVLDECIDCFDEECELTMFSVF